MNDGEEIGEAMVACQVNKYSLWFSTPLLVALHHHEPAFACMRSYIQIAIPRIGGLGQWIAFIIVFGTNRG